jgi:MGT family glycosyltransferase
MTTLCMLGHPAAGHIHPTLPIVAELVRRGDAVHYFATEPFRARIEATGASFASYGDHALFERNLGHAGMLGGMEGLLRTADEILDALLDEVRRIEPELLLVEAHAVWGNLAAQVLGIPAVTLSSMFATSEAALRPAELIAYLYGFAPPQAALDGLLAFGRAFDVARRIDRRHRTRTPGMLDFLGNRQALNIVLTCRALQPRAERLDATYVFTGAALPKAPPRSASKVPRILVSMGTMYNDAPELYRAVFEAFGGNAFRVIAAIGSRIDRGLLPRAPRNVEVRESVAQIDVLRECDLFITHGGINSAHEAMLLGVPMLILPHAADHHIVAQQVADAGAALVLERSEATPALLRALARRILMDPSFAARSAAMGDELRAAGGPAYAADCIQRFLQESSREAVA